ncbi:universal stress protein [Teredinibacter purpureus]|uniref:universal stress protein n=1 Tax=Teredinibacter purpureus TaxID=2731756 RepID=UPI0005F800C9|nr:universal stress protein [Teredinibacter purpureus]
MSTNKQLVLSCIDSSQFSGAVCEYAAWVARTVNAPLKLLHTIEHNPAPVVADYSGAIGLGSSEELLSELTRVEAERSKLLIQKGNLMLQAAKEMTLESGVAEVHTSQRHGSLSESLVEMEEDIRLLVVGIRGEHHASEEKGLGRKLETTIRAVQKPILVVNKTYTEPKKVMLAYDGSDAAQRALEMVATSPLFKNLPCHLVHVVAKALDSDILLSEATAHLQAAGIDVTSVCLVGNSEDVLPAYQTEHDIDLMLMGAFSHNRVRDFLLGSFTLTMLRKTQKPLLLLR